MAKKAIHYYYRIYDDEEQFNYFKTIFQEKKVRGLLKKYEKTHQEYHNSAFVEFLKKLDPSAQLIEVAHISY